MKVYQIWGGRRLCEKKLQSLMFITKKRSSKPGWDIVKRGEFQNDAKFYLFEQKRKIRLHRQSVWNVLRGRRSVQCFPKHMKPFSGQYYIDIHFFEIGGRLRCTQWSEKWLAQLKSIDRNALLVHECRKRCIHQAVSSKSFFIWNEMLCAPAVHKS